VLQDPHRRSASESWVTLLAAKITETKRALAEAEAEEPQLELFEEPDPVGAHLAALRARVVGVDAFAEHDRDFLDAVILRWRRDTGVISPEEYAERKRLELPIFDDVDEVLAEIAAIERRHRA
jgi:hypothetical protein